MASWRVFFYPDGSRCGDGDPLLASYGWAFVAHDAGGNIVAAAQGKPPKWVQSVAATKTWALAEAAVSSFGRSAFRTDCLGVFQICAKGRRFATAAKQVCASVWSRVFNATDGADAIDIGWIPAHTASADVGVLISAEDRDGNGAADTRAKAEAMVGAPSRADIKALADCDELIRTVAKWIEIAGVIASQPGQRDTLASQAAKGARRAAVAAAKAQLPPPRPHPRFVSARPYALGGHLLRACSHGLRCTASTGVRLR